MLNDANLSEANLSKADLSLAVLYRAMLNDANLSDALLFDAELSEADLSEANFANVDLSHTDLTCSYIKYVRGIDPSIVAKIRDEQFRSAKEWEIHQKECQQDPLYANFDPFLNGF